jgi:hypothetical protein
MLLVRRDRYAEDLCVQSPITTLKKAYMYEPNKPTVKIRNTSHMGSHKQANILRENFAVQLLLIATATRQ